MNLHHFESFDSYAQAILAAHARIFLLGPGGNEWRIGHLDVNGIDVQRGVATAPSLCEATGRPTHLTLLLSQPPSSPTWLNGQPFSQDSVGILAPSRGYAFRAAGSNEWIMIALPLGSDLFAGSSLMAQTLRRWADAESMVRTDYLQVAALRDAAITSLAPSCPPEIGRRLIEQRLFDLIASRTPVQRCRGRPSISMSKLCESALKVFREQNATAHVNDLCKAMRISERSLRDFFLACFGMGPGHYLCLRKLHDVYLDLAKNRDPRMTVADCFLQHGYAYSTYAAAHYRRLFLETPSQTRHRLRQQ